MEILWNSRGGRSFMDDIWYEHFANHYQVRGFPVTVFDFALW